MPDCSVALESFEGFPSFPATAFLVPFAWLTASGLTGGLIAGWLGRGAAPPPAASTSAAPVSAWIAEPGLRCPPVLSEETLARAIARRVLRGSRKRGANRRGSEPAGSTLFGLQSLTVLSAFVFGFGCGGVVGVVIGALLWLRSRQDSPAGQELVVVNNRRSAYQLG